MEDLIELLHSSGCSLVVRSADQMVTTYNKKGVRDLMWLIDNEPDRLMDADVADKIIGKAAAGLIINSGVKCVYAGVMSAKAVTLFNKESFKNYSYGTLTERIIIPETDTRCRLESIVEDAQNAKDVETMLRAHFKEMREKETSRI